MNSTGVSRLLIETQYVNGFRQLWPWCQTAVPLISGGRSSEVRSGVWMRLSSSGRTSVRLATMGTVWGGAVDMRGQFCLMSRSQRILLRDVHRLGACEYKESM